MVDPDDVREAREKAIEGWWRLLGYMRAADPGGDWDIGDPFLQAPQWLQEGVRARDAEEAHRG